jgi:hypothetical protein
LLLGDVDFKWLASQGFDFDGIPKGISPPDKSNVYKNGNYRYIKEKQKNNNENLNVLDLCINSFINELYCYELTKPEVVKMHKKLIKHLYD